MKRCRALLIQRVLVALAVPAIVLVIHTSRAEAGQIFSGQGVSFSQVDFTWTAATTLNSGTGLVTVDVATLKAVTGLSEGYINIRTTVGWVVPNLRVLPDFPLTFPGISTYFALGTAPGVDVGAIDAFVDYSATPMTTFPGGPLAAFGVDNAEYNAAGSSTSVPPGAMPPPPPVDALVFQSGETREVVQRTPPDHKSVEAAEDQCAEAAAANSLQWLEDKHGTAKVNIPHDLVQGFAAKGKAMPANSLPAQLDVYMDRRARSFADGDPTQNINIIKGKLKYFVAIGLKEVIKVKHQGLDNKDITAEGMRSVASGPQVTMAFLLDELKAGEDIELCWTMQIANNPGHCVRVVAAGLTKGKPWIKYISDEVQAKAGGHRLTKSDLEDKNSDNILELVYGGVPATLTVAVSESYEPPCHQGQSSSQCPGGASSAGWLLGLGASMMLVRRRMGSVAGVPTGCR